MRTLVNDGSHATMKNGCSNIENICALCVPSLARNSWIFGHWSPHMAAVQDFMYLTQTAAVRELPSGQSIGGQPGNDLFAAVAHLGPAISIPVASELMMM